MSIYYKSYSTKALGHQAPPLSSYVDFEDGIKIPQGKPERSEYQVILLDLVLYLNLLTELSIQP